MAGHRPCWPGSCREYPWVGDHASQTPKGGTTTGDAQERTRLKDAAERPSAMCVTRARRRSCRDRASAPAKREPTAIRMTNSMSTNCTHGSGDTSRTSNARREGACKARVTYRPQTATYGGPRQRTGGKNRWERDARLRGSRKPLGPFPNQGKNLV